MDIDCLKWMPWISVKLGSSAIGSPHPNSSPRQKRPSGAFVGKTLPYYTRKDTKSAQHYQVSGSQAPPSSKNCSFYPIILAGHASRRFGGSLSFVRAHPESNSRTFPGIPTVVNAPVMPNGRVVTKRWVFPNPHLTTRPRSVWRCDFPKESRKPYGGRDRTGPTGPTRNRASGGKGRGCRHRRHRHGGEQSNANESWMDSARAHLGPGSGAGRGERSNAGSRRRAQRTRSFRCRSTTGSPRAGDYIRHWNSSCIGRRRPVEPGGGSPRLRRCGWVRASRHRRHVHHSRAGGDADLHPRASGRPARFGNRHAGPERGRPERHRARTTRFRHHRRLAIRGWFRGRGSLAACPDRHVPGRRGHYPPASRSVRS